jgi:hypothetical protein
MKNISVMKKVNLIVVIVVLVLTFSGTISAAVVLYTPPLNATLVECSVVNVDNIAREVKIRLFESVAGSTPPTAINRELDVTLQAGEAALLDNAVGDPGSSNGHILRYCTFEVKGGKNSVRAGARSLDGDNTHVVAE